MKTGSPTTSRSHSRSVLVIIVRHETTQLKLVYSSVLKGFGPTIGDMVALLARAQRSPSPPEINPLAALPPIPSPEEVRFFDWAMDEHLASTPVVSFPYPGVLIAICGENVSNFYSTQLEVQIKHQVRHLPIVSSFLASPEASFAPTKYFTLDAFVSYSSPDGPLADELRQLLTSHGVEVFLAARSISVADNWEREIHQAICGARVVVMLLTPNSIKSDWVIFEGGAAWALGTPIAVALAYVTQDQLPAALPTYQCRRFETTAERQTFALEIVSILARR